MNGSNEVIANLNLFGKISSSMDTLSMEYIDTKRRELFARVAEKKERKKQRQQLFDSILNNISNGLNQDLVKCQVISAVTIKVKSDITKLSKELETALTNYVTFVSNPNPDGNLSKDEQTKKLKELKKAYSTAYKALTKALEPANCNYKEYIENSLDNKYITIEELEDYLKTNSASLKKEQIDIINDVITAYKAKEKEEIVEEEEVTTDEDEIDNDDEKETSKESSNTATLDTFYAEFKKGKDLKDIVDSIQLDQDGIGIYVTRLMTAITEYQLIEAERHIAQIKESLAERPVNDNSIKKVSLDKQLDKWEKIESDLKKSLREITDFGVASKKGFGKKVSDLLHNIKDANIDLNINEQAMDKMKKADKDADKKERYQKLSNEKEKLTDKLEKLRRKRDAKIKGCSVSIELSIKRKQKRIAFQTTTGVVFQKMGNGIASGFKKIGHLISGNGDEDTAEKEEENTSSKRR